MSIGSFTDSLKSPSRNNTLDQPICCDDGNGSGDVAVSSPARGRFSKRVISFGEEDEDNCSTDTDLPRPKSTKRVYLGSESP